MSKVKYTGNGIAVSPSRKLFLATIPIMMVYPFLQRFFTSGLVMGSVKG